MVNLLPIGCGISTLRKGSPLRPHYSAAGTAQRLSFTPAAVKYTAMT